MTGLLSTAMAGRGICSGSSSDPGRRNLHQMMKSERTQAITPPSRPIWPGRLFHVAQLSDIWILI